MLTAILIFWPLVAALILLVLPGHQVKPGALIAALIELAISLFVAFTFVPTAEPQCALSIPWISSLGINFSIAIDGISL